MNIEKNAVIQSLFPDERTVAAIHISEYLDWAAHPENYASQLTIPPIQRGFVWKPKQIQDLWDSLLRGMPIGSILLKSSKVGDKGTAVEGVRNVEERKIAGFHLMDGQQRTLSMLLGFPGSTEAKHKLWVDFSEAGKNGSQFQFRVSTETQPFGYNSDGGRFSLQERRDARNHWDGVDEERKMQSNSEIFSTEAVRPWKTKGERQDYIFEVKFLWQWLDDSGSDDKKWQEVIMKKLPEIVKDNEIVFSRIESFGKALINLKKQWLALIKIPDSKKQENLSDPSHDYLTMLFERISTGGTRLSPEDLLFSMIKQSWPDAHNIVNKLQEIPDVGSLMKPTDFVMTAFRLAMLIANKEKVTDVELNARSFHNNLAKLLGTTNYPGILREMIDENGDLIKAFKELASLMKYVGEHDGNIDCGFPSAMFPYMNESMLQVILYWFIQNKETACLLGESRDELTRFILFWFVCSRDSISAYKASKVAIGIIFKQKGKFPGAEIYRELTKIEGDKSPLFIPLTTHVKKELLSDTFRQQEERARYFFGENSSSLFSKFSSQKSLLLWLQRDWVANEFPSEKFTPIAGQDEDNVPYDFDHLVPQNNWSSLHSVSTEGIKSAKNKEVFSNLYHRRVIGNSIGNYRVMESSENRSRGKDSINENLLKDRERWNSYAFDPADDELDQWTKAASDTENGCKWDDARLLAFQYAIESRVLHLYDRFYTEAKFIVWLESNSQ